MHRLGGLAALIVVVSVPLSSLPRGGALEADLELARSSVRGGKSLEYVRGVTAIGPRLTGSAAYQRAAEWSADQFREMGITRVSLEPFTIERGWQRVSARARIVAPADRPIHVASLGWSPSTPDGGFEAEVLALAAFSPDALPPRDALQGRIVLLPDGDPPGGFETAARTRRRLAIALRAAGVVAILSADSDPDNELSARGFEFTTAISVLPAAQVGRDDAESIRSGLARGSVRMSLELINRITPGAATVSNVIADLPGRDRPDEWVIVGAHLDSWDFGTGAQDNATGAAMVLEAARAIAALGQAPRRSIRFALWGGEEQGQLGSTAYARAHATELDRVVATLNTDAGTGRVIGWTAPGRADLIRAVRPLTRDFLRELGAATFDDSLRYAFQSDGAPFILAGIPTLDLNADDTRYEDIHHKAADTLDRVDASNLAVGAAIVAATAHAIAEAPARVAPRLDRRSVEQLQKGRLTRMGITTVVRGDTRVAPFLAVRDGDLLRSRGLFVAEGRLVVRRVVEDGRYRVESVLVNEAALRDLEPAMAALDPDVPIMVCTAESFEDIAGYDVHRGCLALVHRPPSASVDEVTLASTLLVVLEGVSNADNVGGVFRNAAAFGADGVLLSPTCCDPLYRKAIRTSMAATLRVPFARAGADDWPGALTSVKAAGFTIVALTPRRPSETLAAFTSRPRPARIALLLGTEGDGLTPDAEAAADYRVRIPIAGGIDSLNLAVATGIALYSLNGEACPGRSSV